MIPRPPRSTRFPYTTLSRSRRDMRTHHRGVEHLNQERGGAGCSERVEEGFEHPRLAQAPEALPDRIPAPKRGDRKSTRLNSSHANISYAVFCLKKKHTKTSL